MAIQSQDNLIASIAADKIARFDFNKITGAAAYTAGRSYDLSMLAGTPVANSYPAAAYVMNTFDDQSGNGTEAFGMQHGGRVSSAVKHLLTLGGIATAATGVPSCLVLCDFLAAYNGINMNLAVTQTVVASSSTGLLLTYATDYPTFSRVRFTTVTTLPTGLSLLTDYWTVRVNATTCRVATSLDNAMAGTVIAYTDIGTGVHTMALQYQTLHNYNPVTFSESTGLLGTYQQDFSNTTRVTFTTTGTLPTGLALLTDYWTIRVNATTCRFAIGPAEAAAGTAISYTNTGSGTHTMRVSIPRYDDGAGVRAFLVAKGTTGASAHNVGYTYTDQEGNAGQVNPVTVAATVSAITPHIIHSGLAANNYGPFLPMRGGDTGHRSFEGVQISAVSGTAITSVLVLVKPLATITLGVAGLYVEKDFLNMFPSLPKVRDGACLGFVLIAGGATAASTTFMGHIETVWG